MWHLVLWRVLRPSPRVGRKGKLGKCDGMVAAGRVQGDDPSSGTSTGGIGYGGIGPGVALGGRLSMSMVSCRLLLGGPVSGGMGSSGKVHDGVSPARMRLGGATTITSSSPSVGGHGGAQVGRKCRAATQSSRVVPGKRAYKDVPRVRRVCMLIS